jgi:DNA-binding transcriptional MerR regulator
MGGGCVLVPYRIGEVAERANVPEDFVRRLIDLGALPGEEAGLGAPEVRRSRLLHSWAAAGLSVETILALVDREPSRWRSWTRR